MVRVGCSLRLTSWIWEAGRQCYKTRNAPLTVMNHEPDYRQRSVVPLT